MPQLHAPAPEPPSSRVEPSAPARDEGERGVTHIDYYIA